MVIWHSSKTSWNLNFYYLKTINWYIKTYKGELLGWLYHSDKNYYTIPLLDNSGDVTPLILFHRGSKPNYFRFDSEESYCEVKCPLTGKVIFEDNPAAKHHENFIKYPWVIMSIGSDDGSVGWMFETEQSARQWVYDLYSAEINLNYYQFLEIFKDNQGWRN